VKNSKTLSESFHRFILGELINDYNCDFCKKKVDVSKKTRISKAPQILTLHLQRIVFNLDTFINEKITNKHEFPTEFNLYPFSSEYYER
jgi:ubiquitin carboxyl-terminal hydrolase 34